MDRIRVESSNLKSVGYDEPRYLLEIEFHSGAVYQYARVPWHIFRGLMDAPSKGAFFRRFILDQYPTTKVEAAAPTAGTVTPTVSPDS